MKSTQDWTDLKRQREALEEYYRGLYKEDEEVIKKEALEYANGDINRAKDFIAGYLHSIKQPHTRSIRLIELYTMDYVPHYRQKSPDKHIVTCIRSIFRNKHYPKELFKEGDPSKRESDGSSNSKSSGTSGTTEGSD